MLQCVMPHYTILFNTILFNAMLCYAMLCHATQYCVILNPEKIFYWIIFYNVQWKEYMEHKQNKYDSQYLFIVLHLWYLTSFYWFLFLVISGYKRILGPVHPDTMQSIRTLSLIHATQGLNHEVRTGTNISMKMSKNTEHNNCKR